MASEVGLFLAGWNYNGLSWLVGAASISEALAGTQKWFSAGIIVTLGTLDSHEQARPECLEGRDEDRPRAQWLRAGLLACFVEASTRVLSSIRDRGIPPGHSACMPARVFCTILIWPLGISPAAEVHARGSRVPLMQASSSSYLWHTLRAGRNPSLDTTMSV